MKTLTSRESTYSQVTSYEERLAIWQEAVEGCRDQIELSRTFQNAGRKIIAALQSIKSNEEVDPEKLLKQYNACLSGIEKGTKLEREARQELSALQYRQPKDV